MKPHLFFFFSLSGWSTKSSVFLFSLLYVFLKMFSYSLTKMSVSNPLTRIFNLFSVVSSCEKGLESYHPSTKMHSDITPWFQLTWIIYSTSFLTVNYSAWSCYQGWWNWFVCLLNKELCGLFFFSTCFVPALLYTVCNLFWFILLLIAHAGCIVVVIFNHGHLKYSTLHLLPKDAKV